MPVSRAGATLIVAMSDPSNIYAIDDLKFRTGLNIEVVVASEVAIDEAGVQYCVGEGQATIWLCPCCRPDSHDVWQAK